MRSSSFSSPWGRGEARRVRREASLPLNITEMDNCHRSQSAWNEILPPRTCRQRERKKQERAGAHSFQGRRERTELKMLNSPTDVHSSFHGIINVWLGEVEEERPHALLVRSFCLVALERGGVKGASSFLLSFASLQEDPLLTPPLSVGHPDSDFLHRKESSSHGRDPAGIRSRNEGATTHIPPPFPSHCLL